MARKPAPLPPTPVFIPEVPRWLRQAVQSGSGDTAAFAAGAALALLDPLARDEDLTSTLWRKRLALAAALAHIRLEGRREREGALRDTLALRQAGEDPGPAGRILQGWRFLCEARALQVADQRRLLPAAFGLSEAGAAALIAGAQAMLPGRSPVPAYIARVIEPVLEAGADYRGLALWLGDAALARALGHARPLPLLAAHLPRRALALRGADLAQAIALALAEAVLAALSLAADISRKAAALRLAAPRLRGRDAAAVVTQLLSEDALAAQAGEKASDRAARRLFDRLTGLGLVEELTGRPSFRLYGL